MALESLFRFPMSFWLRSAEKLGLSFRPPDSMAWAWCFCLLTRNIVCSANRCWSGSFEEEGQRILGWRDVPVDSSAIGSVAHEAEPVIRQIFIAKSPFLDAQQFERKLYVIRRRATTTIEAAVMEDVGYFYIVSLSSRTLIYKGQLMARQMATFFLDLNDTSMKSGLALVHSRFSTNTFPSWRLAHPFRYLAHNGEINTLRGNRNWMRARSATLASDIFGDDLKKLFPIVTETGSDSATLDNALEFLIQGGRSLPHAVMMLIPEAWSKNIGMDPDKKGFYEYHACLMEPWDGPAAVAFTDGVSIGAVLDRNGLRPARYYVTKNNLVVMASEVGVLDIPADEVLYKGRLQPGKFFLVDTEQGRIVDDGELKASISRQKPYREWVETNKIDFASLPEPKNVPQSDPQACCSGSSSLDTRWRIFASSWLRWPKMEKKPSVRWERILPWRCFRTSHSCSTTTSNSSLLRSPILPSTRSAKRW